LPVTVACTGAAAAPNAVSNEMNRMPNLFMDGFRALVNVDMREKQQLPAKSTTKLYHAQGLVRRVAPRAPPRLVVRFGNNEVPQLFSPLCVYQLLV
jgi:hypothetical protein